MRWMRGMHACLVVLGLIAVLAAASPAAAQYIYMDTNGDGLNTWADSLNATGTTALDIWIDSGFNRNGSPGGCRERGLASFSLNIHADGGTINWGTFTSAITPSSGPPSVSNPHEYHIEVALTSGGTTVPLGLYKLGTLIVEIASGDPCLRFAANTTMSSRHSTSFGAGCPGKKIDHTSRLDEEWFDEDGSVGHPSAAPRVFAPGLVLPQYLDPVVVDVQTASTNCGTVSSLVANLSALPAGSNAVFTAAPDNSSGTLTWQPTVNDHGDFFVTFTAAGKNPNATDSRTTIIRLVTNPVSVDETEGTKPVLALWQNRPNPFNPATTLVYSVPAQTRARLIVYDISGRAAARLVDRVESIGRHEVHWLGEDDRGRPLASGVYICRLTTAFGGVTRRLVLAR
jgi:hypothetical protein